MESLMAVVGSFFLYLLIFPLIGAGIGLFLRVLLPNLFGGLLIYLLMERVFMPTGAWWELAIPLLAWAALVLGTRQIAHRSQAWHEGHWRAVLLAVTFGLWRLARPQRVSIEEQEYGSAEA